jgi:hypothetical protein
MIMMMMMIRRRRNSILTAKRLFADSNTTQSYVLSVTTVGNNAFNITQQCKTEYLKYMQSNIS